MIITRIFLVALAALQASCYVVERKPFPSLLDATIEELQSGLGSGLLTSVDLVKAYIERIEEVNDATHAVTEINPDALDIAAALDEERAKDVVRGPLHGIPILLKNNIGSADRMSTTAGSYALLGSKVPRDATVASKLRAAGAVIIGKANLSQWAGYRSGGFSSTVGWSAYGGQTIGAYVPDQDPCGSSSGSGTAIALGLAAAALGTETDGSITCPSHRNNLVGLKPTVGLTSRYLVVPISSHQDTIGPMTRTVRDAAAVLAVLAGPDPEDKATLKNPHGDNTPDYLAACDPNALNGARIGVPVSLLKEISGSDEFGGAEFDAYFAAVEAVLKPAGAHIIKETEVALYNKTMDNLEDISCGADFISDLASYLAQLTYNPNNIHSLSDVRDFTQAFTREEYPSRNTEAWDITLDVEGYNATDPRAREAYERAVALMRDVGVWGALERYKLDAIMMPAKIAPPYAAIWGGPIVTVPLGFYPEGSPVKRNLRGNLIQSGPGVPFGVSFLGLPWSEEKLIGLAYAFEQRTKARWRHKPWIVPKHEVPISTKGFSEGRMEDL